MVPRLYNNLILLNPFSRFLTLHVTNKYATIILWHGVFPGGPPSKYYPGPTMLNFRDLTRTGVFIEVWWYTAVPALYLYLRCTNTLRSLIISFIGVGSNPTSG